MAYLIMCEVLLQFISQLSYRHVNYPMLNKLYTKITSHNQYHNTTTNASTPKEQSKNHTDRNKKMNINSAFLYASYAKIKTENVFKTSIL